MTSGTRASAGHTRPRALVTGGAKRVGRATAEALARAGCDVEITFLSSQQEADEVVRSLRDAAGPGATMGSWRLDLNDPLAVERFAAERASQPLDVLVHNASSYGPTPLESLIANDALAHYRVNALAPLLLSAGLARTLARSERPGGGAIVCMCDVHTTARARKHHAAYNMSKGAMDQLVRSLAIDLAPRVRVNGVAPGVVAFPDAGPESDLEMQKRYLARVPLARSGTPQDAAELVRWLALDGHYVTGVIVPMDGGVSVA